MADETTNSQRTVTTTVTRRRVVEKVGVGRRRALWPLAILPFVPAVAAAINFDDDAKSVAVVETTVAAVVETTVAAAPETTVAAAPETTVAAAAPETTVATAPETTVAAAVDTTVAAAPATTEAAAAVTVADIVAGSADHKSLGAALGAADLTTTLSGAGPFTVFAPTDAAFAKLPAGVVDELLKPENKGLLTQVLTYHVVPGPPLVESDLTGAKATVDGSTIELASGASGITVSDTAGTTGIVTTPGIPASNGIVYVVDSVLLPPGFVPPGQTNAAGDAVAEDLTIYFATGSDRLDLEASAKVERAVEILGALPEGTKVKMVGHADVTGNADANRRLSERRVNRVLQAVLAGLGDQGSKIDFSSDFRGATEPAEDLAKSRRVTIEIQQG
jgi:uncharacterized surface protein with fasciclin (FAS1) repeats